MELSEIDCRHCHKALQNENAYEDGIYTILVEWLCAITCMKWIRAYPDFRKPDCRESQYGMVFVNSYELLTSSEKLQEIQHVDAVETDGTPVTKTCTVIEESELVTIDLEVHGEYGEPSDCKQEGEAEATIPHRSATDVMRHIRRMLRKMEFMAPLNVKGISFREATPVSAEARKHDAVWEHFTSMQITLQMCTHTSYPADNALLFYCIHNCDGKPLCIRPEFDCPEP